MPSTDRGQLDRALPELRRKRCRHNDILPRRSFRLKVESARPGKVSGAVAA
jgi:hypothetical protein